MPLPTDPIPPDEYAALSRQARTIARGEPHGTSYAHHVIRLMNMVETERKANEELRGLLKDIRPWVADGRTLAIIDTALSKES